MEWPRSKRAQLSIDFIVLKVASNTLLLTFAPKIQSHYLRRILRGVYSIDP